MDKPKFGRQPGHGADDESCVRCYVYEASARDEREDNPSLYLYLHTAHCMIESRGGDATEDVDKLYDFLYHNWMSDTPVLSAVEEWMEADA